MVPMIALLTDFGLSDVYVAEMKAVLLSRNPHRVIDLTHDVAPGDIRHGQFLLATSRKWFPAETIFVAVVDPGVGTARPEVAVRYEDQWFVAPDNGLLSFAAGGAVFRIVPDDTFPKAVSATFHGRDRFAPAAARIADGDTSCLVPTPGLTVVEPLPWVFQAPGTGMIGHVDRFGNLVTTVSAELAGTVTLTINGMRIGRWSETFAEGGDDPFLIPGSRGMIEVAVNRGSAAMACKADRQTTVEVNRI